MITDRLDATYKRFNWGTKREVPEPGLLLTLGDHFVVIGILLLVDVEEPGEASGVP